jgi:polyferredoxin
MKGRFQIVFSDKLFVRNQREGVPRPSFALRLKHRIIAFLVAALATAFVIAAVFVGSLIAVLLSASLLIVILVVIFRAAFGQTIRNLRAK